MSQDYLSMIINETDKDIDAEVSLSNHYDNSASNGIINVFDRKEIGRVADAITEWKYNCYSYAY